MAAAITRTLLHWIENLLIAGFIVMIGLVFGNVVLRYGFDSGIILSEEVARMIFVWLTFGGAYLVAREGGHLGMTMVVEKLGSRGRWWCRLAAEVLSVACMLLLIVGCWRQTLINLHNHAPITGAPLAIPFAAGLVGGFGILSVNLITISRLLTGRLSDAELVGTVESEDLARLQSDSSERRTP